MKACLTNPERFTPRHEDALRKGLLSSCARNLTGHGYEGRKGQVESLNIFMKAGLREFIDLHSDFCPEFTEMIEKIITRYSEMESRPSSQAHGAKATRRKSDPSTGTFHKGK